jgi:hypothetical protein
MAAMRKRVPLAAVALAGAGVLAGLLALVPAAPPPARAVDAPFLIPQDLTWQFTTSCETPDELEACLDRYEFEQRADGFSYVDAAERAQLWEYYTAVTVPCLAARGVDVPPVTRQDFFLPDERPWNPYTALRDIPFDTLVGHYAACPPVPAYLQERHQA